MLTIEEKITRLEHFAELCEQNGMEEWQKEHEQLAEWLKELQERREKDNCYGCKHKPFEEKHRCRSCKRMCLDKYEPERRTD